MSGIGMPMIGKSGSRRVQQHISSLSNTAARGMHSFRFSGSHSRPNSSDDFLSRAEAYVISERDIYHSRGW